MAVFSAQTHSKFLTPNIQTAVGLFANLGIFVAFVGSAMVHPCPILTADRRSEVDEFGWGHGSSS